MFEAAFEKPHGGADRHDLSRNPRAASKRTTAGCRTRTGRGPTILADGRGRAVSAARADAARRVARRPCCSTAMSRRATGISASAGPTIRRTTGCSPGRPTGRARNIYTIIIRDLATGEDTGEVIEETADGVVWAADGRSFYYTEYDDSHRPFRVRRHVLGTPQSDGCGRLRGGRSGLLRQRRRNAEPAATSSSMRTTTRRRRSG